MSILEKLRSDQLAQRLQQETGLAPGDDDASGDESGEQGGAGRGSRDRDGGRGRGDASSDSDTDDDDDDDDEDDDDIDDPAAIFNAEELEELQSPKQYRRGTRITAVDERDHESGRKQRGRKRSRSSAQPRHSVASVRKPVLAVGNIVDSLQSMLVEVQSEYVRSVKRSIVEYNLLSPEQQGRFRVNVEALKRAYTPEVRLTQACWQ